MPYLLSVLATTLNNLGQAGVMRARNKVFNRVYTAAARVSKCLLFIADWEIGATVTHTVLYNDHHH